MYVARCDPSLLYSQKLLHIPQKVDWGTLISNVVWAYGGFDTMGTLAGTIIELSC